MSDNSNHVKKIKHEFWDTQPVLKIDEEVEGNEQYDNVTSVDQVRKTPYKLPADFIWDSNFDITNQNSLDEIYELLCEHYVEDQDNLFRFKYSKDFLKWALMPPGWRPEWHLGIRYAKNQKLFGFITAIPCIIYIGEKKVESVDVNFLCVNKKARGFRMATVLIREIRRLVNMEGIFQAVYTVGKIISKPASTSCYYHRLLTPKKLVECDFAVLPARMNMKLFCKLYSVDKLTSLPQMKPMESRHCKSAHLLLNQFLSKYGLRVEFSFEEFCHWFLPRENVVSSFVVENEDGQVVDFISMYHLASSVLNNSAHDAIYAGYIYYYAYTCNTLVDLVSSLLLWACRNGFDTFNALNIMDNQDFFHKLNFGRGDGTLHYYLFNWKTASLPPNQVGIVLQ